MDFVDKTKTSAPLISLDAENTFDSVRWEFFYLVSQRFGFNEKAINCFKSLYSSPTARIKINGNISNSIGKRLQTRMPSKPYSLCSIH